MLVAKTKAGLLIQIGKHVIVLRSPIILGHAPQFLTTGITNRTADNYFILFLDYDNVDYEVVREDIDFLQKNFDIGTVITRVSSEERNLAGVEIGNYHAIAFTRFTFPEIKEMLQLTRCDDKFKRIGGELAINRSWVLRILEKYRIDQKTGKVIPVKPATKLKEIIPAKTKRTASLGHILFFERLDGIELRKYFRKTDGLSHVEVIPYEA